MIALASNFLLFQLPSGENVPLSAEMISEELMGKEAAAFEPEFVRNAAAAVFHYFRQDMGRETVSVAEFSELLQKVLRNFGANIHCVKELSLPIGKLEDDLQALARQSGEVRELAFFPQLRNAVRSQLSISPRLVRFRGLRDCVFHLTGARRWSPRCDRFREQILEYIRQCFGAEPHSHQAALVVE